MDSDFEREAESLSEIAERLADASIDLLAAAIGESDRDAAKEAEYIERELQKARRAVVKAEGILRGIRSHQDD